MRVSNRPAVDLPFVNIEPIAQVRVVAQRLLPAFLGQHQRERQRYVAVRREGNIKDVFAGTIPFVAAMILMTAILIHFLEVALWIRVCCLGQPEADERAVRCGTRPAPAVVLPGVGAVLLLLMFIPALSTWLPRLLLKH